MIPVFTIYTFNEVALCDMNESDICLSYYIYYE